MTGASSATFLSGRWPPSQIDTDFTRSNQQAMARVPLARHPRAVL